MASALTEIFIASIPVLLLIGAWFFYMRKKDPVVDAQKQLPAYMKKHLELTERMTVALEKLADIKDKES